MKPFGATIITMSAPNQDTTLELASRVRQVIVPLARQIQRRTMGNFTPTELSIIGAVLRHEPISLRDLAARERLSPPTISKVIAALERDDMVKRIPDVQDRRVCRVQITAAGRQWVDTTRTARNEWLAERIVLLSLDERKELSAAITVLQRFIDDE